ncbi:hypothetical protein BGL48_03910 [Salinivibrio sp. SS3]|uniref:hypothetical protein n=1 Tax=Salinivibrio sp. SS3 TaxID=1895021 RepID=UPI000847E2F3|nr:hypothetical protein [Salinivibrio sp. BNH]ODP96230.1 hypothetical protein BGL48_03910 [Salinivibrio sp. BNH]
MTILHAEDALSLLRQGKSAWNNWVLKNRRASISFRNFDFSTLEEKEIDFKHLTFPQGELDFSGANFSDKIINFYSSKLHCKKISFFRCQTDGILIFLMSRIRTEKMEFSFLNSCGQIIFLDASVEVSHLDFSKSKLDSSTLFLWGVDLSKCFIDLRDSTIKNSEVTLEHASLSSIAFDGAKMSASSLNFKASTSSQHVSLSDISVEEPLKQLSFRHAFIEKGLEITSPDNLGLVPDFVGSKIEGNFVFNHENLKLEREKKFLFSVAKNRSDGERLCRLKEVSESNKDHKLSLKLFQMEMQARRWQDKKILSGLLDATYDTVSDYGQSIIKPVTILSFLILIHSFYLTSFNLENIDNAALLSISKAVPFVSGAKDTVDYISPLFQGKTNNFVSIIYSILCYGSLFLIGLGIRNRFRL